MDHTIARKGHIAVNKKGRAIEGSTRSLNEVPHYANVIMHGCLALASLICILPLVMIIASSLSSEQLLVLNGYRFWPQGFSTAAYRFLFQQGEMVAVAYRNTIVSTVAGTLLCMVTVGLYAYPLSRKDFRFTKFFTFVSFFTMLFGGGLMPFYVLCTQVLRIGDTIWALFLTSGFSAYWVIIMRTFYRTNVPEEVIESARIDGAGEWRTLLQIVTPLAIPGLATVALYSTIGLWNNFFNCLLLVKSEGLINLQYMIYKTLNSIRYIKEAAALMGSSASSNLSTSLADLPSESFRMAMAVITIGPILFAYPFFQRFFVKGLTIGAVKG